MEPGTSGGHPQHFRLHTFDYSEWLEEVNSTQRMVKIREEIRQKELKKLEKENERLEEIERRKKEIREQQAGEEGKEDGGEEEGEYHQPQPQSQPQEQQQQQQQQQHDKKQQRTAGDLLWTKITPGRDHQRPHLLEFIAVLPLPLHFKSQANLTSLFFISLNTPPTLTAGLMSGLRP